MTFYAVLRSTLGVQLYELFVHDVYAPDKLRMKLLNEILDLLKMAQEQVKSIVVLKDCFINRLKK